MTCRGQPPQTLRLALDLGDALVMKEQTVVGVWHPLLGTEWAGWHGGTPGARSLEGTPSVEGWGAPGERVELGEGQEVSGRDARSTAHLPQLRQLAWTAGHQCGPGAGHLRHKSSQTCLSLVLRSSEIKQEKRKVGFLERACAQHGAQASALGRTRAPALPCTAAGLQEGPGPGPARPPDPPLPRAPR